MGQLEQRAPKGLKIRQSGRAEILSCPMNAPPFVDGGPFLNGPSAAILVLVLAPLSALAALIYGTLSLPVLITPALLTLAINGIFILPVLWFWIQRIHVTIENDTLTVVPWPKMWASMRFHRSEIDQIYCTEERKVSGPSGSYSQSESRRNPFPQYQNSQSSFFYKIHLISKENEHYTLGSTVTAEQAKAIEAHIEEALGLRHRSVPGELILKRPY